MIVLEPSSRNHALMQQLVSDLGGGRPHMACRRRHPKRWLADCLRQGRQDSIRHLPLKLWKQLAAPGGQSAALSLEDFIVNRADPGQVRRLVREPTLEAKPIARADSPALTAVAVVQGPLGPPCKAAPTEYRN